MVSAEYQLLHAWRSALSGPCTNETAACVHTLCAQGLATSLEARALREANHNTIVPAAEKLAATIASFHTPHNESMLLSIATNSFAEQVCNAYKSVAGAFERIVWLNAEISKAVSIATKDACSSFPVATTMDNRLTRRFVLQSRTHFNVTVPSLLSKLIYHMLLDSVNQFEECAGVGEDRTSSRSCRTVCASLIGLGFSHSVEEALGWLLFQKIDSAIAQHSKSHASVSSLTLLRSWMDHTVIPWLTAVLEANQDEDAMRFERAFAQNCGKDTEQHRGTSTEYSFCTHASISLEQWRKRLAFHLHEKLAVTLIACMPNIISSFSESLCALQDLKECLSLTEKKSLLVQSLRQQFQAQLLHAGVSTSDILQQYINMIKALQFLDPAGVILENVSDPIRSCLRSRPDTVRCIVNEITGGGDLFAELERGNSRLSRRGTSDMSRVLDMDRTDENDENVISTLIRNSVGGVSTFATTLTVPIDDDDGESDAGDDSEADSVDTNEYELWEPEPVDAPLRRGRWRRCGDAIETLVAIYGSSEQIVSEYRTMLADKLVSSSDIELEREGRILALLQQRFGVDAMHDCVVMLKDMHDSRASLEIAKVESPSVAKRLAGFQTTVISKEFWPKLTEEPIFKLPSQLSACMAQFSASFERVKEPRKLRWLQGLGMADVNVTFEDGRMLKLSLTPFQLAIVLRFAHRPRWTVEELQKDMEVADVAALRRRLVFLANQDVIRATDAHASAYEAIENSRDVDSGVGVADDDTGGIMPGLDADDEKGDQDSEMTVYESYIMAMLKNLKALPLDRIHTMLQMVVKTPAYDKSKDQLASFLAQLEATEKVELKAGMYKVRQ